MTPADVRRALVYGVCLLAAFLLGYWVAGRTPPMATGIRTAEQVHANWINYSLARTPTEARRAQACAHDPEPLACNGLMRTLEKPRTPQ